MSNLVDDWDSIKDDPVPSGGPSHLVSDWDSIPSQTQQPPKIKSFLEWAFTPATSGYSEGSQKAGRLKEAAAQYDNETRNSPWKALPPVGATEATLNMGTGLASSSVGGLAGLFNTFYQLGKNQKDQGLHLPTMEEFNRAVDKGASTTQSVQRAGTYQPRTGAGKLLTEAVNLPLDVASDASGNVMGDIGKVIGGEKGRMMGESFGKALPAAVTALTMLPKKAAPQAPTPKVEPTLGNSAEALNQKYQVWRQGGKEPAASVNQPVAEAAQQLPAKAKDPASVYVEAEKLAPAADVSSGEAVLPKVQQQQRAGVLQRIGLTDARKSAIEGDAMTGSVISQMAKFDEPAGRAAQQILNNEREALRSHAEKIARDTGGTLGMDEGSLNARGQSIAAPFDALREHYKSKIDELYKAADERAGGMPATSLDEFGSFLKKQSNFAGKAENSSLGRGIKAYLTEQGIMDKKGTLSPITAQQAEGIKQYINSQYSHETSGLAGKIKEAIDNDVMRGAGEDVYAAGRSLYKEMKEKLDDPTGISKLFDYDPRTPINRATPFNKLANELKNLSPAQFKHVIDTLKNMPPELQPQAQAALAEIKSHFANSVLETGNKFEGKWNARGVTRELSNHSQKLPMIFNDAELAALNDLNQAGHILSVDKSYPGAAAQANNAVKQGLMPHLVGSALTGGGGVVGSVFGPLGTYAGSVAGRSLGNKISTGMAEKEAVKNLNKKMVKLSDVGKETEKSK